MNPTRERMEGRFERTLTVTGPVSLDVSVHAGVIRVFRGEPGSVVVRGVLRARSPLFMGLFVGGAPGERIRTIESNPPIRQDENAIGIGDVKDRWLLRGINLLLEITTPPDTEVRALADSGDIRIEGDRRVRWSARPIREKSISPASDPMCGCAAIREESTFNW